MDFYFIATAYVIKCLHHNLMTFSSKRLFKINHEVILLNYFDRDEQDVSKQQKLFSAVSASRVSPATAGCVCG